MRRLRRCAFWARGNPLANLTVSELELTFKSLSWRANLGSKGGYSHSNPPPPPPPPRPRGGAGGGGAAGGAAREPGGGGAGEPPPPHPPPPPTGIAARRCACWARVSGGAPS